MGNFAPEICHEHLLKTTVRSLAFSPERDFEKWRCEVDEKLRELIGVLPERTPPNIRIEFEEENDLFEETRFVFASEAYCDVPCHLLIPKKGKKPFPVMICVQGHTPGMHLSLGRPRNESEKEQMESADRDFAIQAVRQGYAALAIEQRCLGERKHNRSSDVLFWEHTCVHASMVSLLLGRTMIGQRVWDVSRAIDLLDEFDGIDTSRIGCLGNSGGGTTTFFAACLDDRISIAMPSCYVCTFQGSIGVIDHCVDNYVPGIFRYCELGDLACLIAPRPLVVVAGREDSIFPIKAVEEAFDTIGRIYDKAGVPDRCELVVGEGGHRFFGELAWPVFRKLSGWEEGSQLKIKN